VVTGGVILVCFDVCEVWWIGEHANGGYDLLNNIPVRLQGCIGEVSGVFSLDGGFVEVTFAVAEEVEVSW
jgi:hypothetical protein